MKQKKVIMPTDPEAAEIVTVTGWRSRIGRFWGDDERMARYDGSTHRPCANECGMIVSNHSFALCPYCMEKAEFLRYQEAPQDTWDEVSALYSEADDIYFFDREELEEYLLTECKEIGELRLYLCKPIFAREVTSDIFENELGTDSELPDEIAEALAVFNLAVKKYGKPLSWEPTKIAAVLEKSE